MERRLVARIHSFVTPTRRILATKRTNTPLYIALADQPLILAGLVGATVGVGVAWLFMRLRYNAVFAEKESRLNENHAAEKLALSTSLASLREVAARIPTLESELADRSHVIETLRSTNATSAVRCAALETQLSEERQQSIEKLAILDRAQAQLSATFEALSLQALQKSSQSFLDLARTQLGQFQERASGDLAQKQQAIDELLRPMRESLSRVDTQIQEMERSRAGAYEGLVTQVRSLIDTQQQLRGETGRLVNALHSPIARGRWGEIQLRRVVELAGMQSHCDFYEQQTTDSSRLRPDLLVKMPGGKAIVIDSKVPFAAYYRAFECSDESSRTTAFREHAGAVREHIRTLAAKCYWEQFSDAPEFVILFLPGETFFSAALEHDPELIEFGATHRVILATPTTLIALLRAVHYGWRQEKLTENAQRISDLGRELYDRLATLGDHMSRLGKHLDNAVDSYNKAAGSLESRVLVTARRFKELEATSDRDITPLEPLDHTTRPLQSPELQAASPD
jgi:DNA recombination protein RmuC